LQCYGHLLEQVGGLSLVACDVCRPSSNLLIIIIIIIIIISPSGVPLTYRKGIKFADVTFFLFNGLFGDQLSLSVQKRSSPIFLIFILFLNF